MPNWQFSDSIFVFTLILCSVTVILGLVYFNCIYHDDRSESLLRWANAMAKAGSAVASQNSIDEEFDRRPSEVDRAKHPDIVIVFHHPDHAEKDNDKKLPSEGMDHIIVDDHDKDIFQELETLRREARSESVTRGQAREALLKDLDSVLPQWGFTVTAFQSCDEDEVFFAVSLRNPSTISYFLAQTEPSLQVRQDMAKRLSIDQDPEDPCSSAPFLRYSVATVNALAVQHITASSDETALYKPRRCAALLTVMSSKDCIRTISTELGRHVDLVSSEAHKLIVMWYPAHDPEELATLRAIWANWGNMSDLSFVQPVTYLKDYFGARIAFLFAWNGVYCKALIPICVIAMIQFASVGVSKFYGSDLVRERQVVAFSTVLTVWSRVAYNLWEREQNFFLELWGLSSFDEEGLIRPQFNGEFEKSPIDGNLTEKQDSHKLHVLRHAVATIATMFFCFIVGVFLFSWMITFQGHTNFVSSVMLSTQIKIFQFCFKSMATALTDFENHKYQDSYHNSLIWKLFTFEFVNNYSVFIFLTIKDSWRDDDEKGDALFKTQRQITVTLCVLSIMSIAQVPLQDVITRFWLWYEHYQLKRTLNGEEPPARSFAEEQSKYKKLEDTDEVQCVMTLVIALGFVLLFGGVSAWVVPFCFAVFAVQIRALAVLLTSHTQRTFPHRCRGMGYWCGVVNFLNVLGLCYSGFLFVAYGRTFHKAALLAKVTGFILFCSAMGLLWVFVDMFFPPQDPSAHLLARRRKHVLDKIHHFATTQELAKHPETSKRLRRGLTRSNTSIARGDWSALLTSSEAHTTPGPTPKGHD
jgi:hypothetical protein